MLLKLLRKEKRVIQVYTLVIFLLMSSVFLAATVYTQVNEDQIQKSEIQTNEQSIIMVEKEYIANRISVLISDALYAADSLRIHLEEHEDYDEIAELWISFIDRKNIYDQIRYIATNGQEIVRINHDPDDTYAVSVYALQNKSNRPYFINTMTLERNQIYISQLDLNIDYGVLEYPLKPIIRLATPYYGAENTREGVIVLNYAAEELLQQVRNIASTSVGNVFLLDLDGYWLYNSEDSEKEWGFMFEDRANVSFAQEYPEEWERISSSDSGFFTTDQGTFSYNNIILDSALLERNEDVAVFCDSGVFYIVTHILPDTHTGAMFSDSIWQSTGKVFVKHISIYALMSGIAFIFAIFVAMNRAQKKEIKYFSEYDAMTGVLNRRSGYEKLKSLRKDTAKENCQVSICFLDVNGLKEVNDTLGHDAGDELILSAVEIIKKSIREKDFVVRLGGDEFLIVFDGLDAVGAEKVWQRILEKYERINAEENRPYLISISHGIEMFVCNTGASVDDIINLADEQMYSEKKEMKKNIRIIQNHPDARSDYRI